MTDAKIASAPSVTAAGNSLVKRDADGDAVVRDLSAREVAADSVAFLTTALVKRGSGDALLETTSGLYLNGAGSRTAGGGSNVGVGFNTLGSLTTGSSNIAIGAGAGTAIGSNVGNVLIGTATADVLASGDHNVGVGLDALGALTLGTDNIAIGRGSGGSLTSGSDNIYLASAGAGSESGVIRIGSSSQSTAFVAGVRNTPVSLGGVDVQIGNDGQLGIVVSTVASKTDIADVSSYLDRVDLLRPVRFRYRHDPRGEIQFGLIAEDVERVFPELALRDAEGTLQSVRYHLLAPLVLARAQATQRELVQVKARLEHAEAALARYERRLADLEARADSGEGR